MNPQVDSQGVKRAWGAVLVGFAFTCLGIFLGLRSEAFLHDAAYAKGIVVDVVANRPNPMSTDSQQSGTTYVADISFTDANGKAHTFRDDSGYGFLFSYHKGDEVKVAYQRETPEVAHIDSFEALWGMPLTFAGSGLIAFFAGIVYFVRRAKEKRMSSSQEITGSV